MRTVPRKIGLAMLGWLGCGDGGRDGGSGGMERASAEDSADAEDGGAGSSGGEGSSTGGTTAGTTSGSGTGTASTGDGGGEGPAEDEGGTPRLDVASGSGTGGAGEAGGDMGCQKVDFLFVVDNSGSMQSAQSRLVTSFPGFIAAIRDKVAGKDFHIMVVDSDADPTWACEPSVHAGSPACTSSCSSTCDPNNSTCFGYTCGANVSLGEADKTLGCAVVHPIGGQASNRDCGFPADRRYLTALDADLEAKFACAAQVGVSGDWWEKPASAMRAALSPELGASGACNAGFLRPDAILVVTFISDDVENDFDQDDVKYGVAGTPMEWYEELVARKSGNAEAIVFLGAIATPGVALDPVNCPHGTGPGIVFAGPKFAELVALFGDHGLVIDTCVADYAPFFADAIDLVDGTCDEFVPPVG